MSNSSHGRGGALSPASGSSIPHHAPMSERQQLALIKRLELAASTTSNGSANNDALMVSPPRAPLQVVNGPNPNGSNPSTPLGNISTHQKFSDDFLHLGRINNSPALERLLKKISKRNSKGETPLHTAAIRGSPRLVRQLLMMGADPNAQDHAEWSPLHEACNRGNRGVVRVLLEFGADLNLKGFGKDSPMHDAARNGHIKVVKFLIKAGADIFSRNAAGRTPREEAEATLERVETDELTNTIAFLREEETRSFEQTTSHYSDVSDGDEDDEEIDDNEEEKEEPENEDVAKFLGVAKSSPDVQKAFRSLGLSSKCKSKPRLRDVNSVTPIKTSSSSSISSDKKRNSVKSVSKHNSILNGGSTSKLRLTYGADKSSANVEDSNKSNSESRLKDETEDIDLQFLESTVDPTLIRSNEEASKRRRKEEENRFKRKKKKRRNVDNVDGITNPELNSIKSDDKPDDLVVNNGESSANVDVLDSNVEMKVPPLKIILSSSNSNNVATTANPHRQETDTCSSTNNDISINSKPEMSHFKQFGVRPPETEEKTKEWSTNCASNTKGGESKMNQDVTSQDAALLTTSKSSTTATTVSSSDRPASTEYPHMKKRKLVMQLTSALTGEPAAREETTATVKQGPPNDIEKFLSLRKQIEQRRKNLFPVLPKPPEGYKDYLMNKKNYLLQDNSQERLKSIPRLDPPMLLSGVLRDLFREQEKDRFKLRVRHVVEKEKLVLAVEQEILRVHARAARALANQSVPYSVCTILKDEEIYNPIPEEQSTDQDRSRDPRSRYNGRIFLSWLQDVDDKWEKIKLQMLARHHHEAESLHAVQKMDWEYTVTSSGGVCRRVDLLDVPIVDVSRDFPFDLK